MNLNEPCRFVSEGEKSAVRSNRPLIFLSCIKGTTLGGCAGEQALLIFSVYLMLFTNVCTLLLGTSPNPKYTIQASVLHCRWRQSPPRHWFCLCRIIGNTDVSCDQKESRKEEWLQNLCKTLRARY